MLSPATAGRPATPRSTGRRRRTRAGVDGPAAGRRARAGALPALCVTQVVGWGVLYYAFPVMLPTICGTPAGPPLPRPRRSPPRSSSRPSPASPSDTSSTAPARAAS